jgi:hypothetical protein
VAKLASLSVKGTLGWAASFFPGNEGTKGQAPASTDENCLHLSLLTPEIGKGTQKTLFFPQFAKDVYETKGFGLDKWQPLGLQLREKRIN